VGSITVKGSVDVNGVSDLDDVPKRRRRRLLSVDSILDAALALVDEHGRLTMAELATRLGSSASSIYHHLPGRDAILEALRERLGRDIGTIPVEQTWDAGLATWLRRYRDVFAAHPNLIPLLTGQTITDPTVLASYEAVTGMLLRGGFPEDEVVLWLSVVDNFALGSALDLAAPDEVWRPSAPAGQDSPTPRMDAAVRAATRGRERADAAFELGLTALVAGMRAHLDAAADNG